MRSTGLDDIVEGCILGSRPGENNTLVIFSCPDAQKYVQNQSSVYIVMAAAAAAVVVVVMVVDPHRRITRWSSISESEGGETEGEKERREEKRRENETKQKRDEME